MIVDERKNPEDIRKEGMKQLADSSKEPEDILDIEIENMRMIIMKVSQRIHEEKMDIYIIKERKQHNHRSD